MARGRDVVVEADPKKMMKTRMKDRLAQELGSSNDDRALDLHSDEEIGSFNLVGCHRFSPVFGDYSPDLGCCCCRVGRCGADGLDPHWGCFLGRRPFLAARESVNGVVNAEYRHHNEKENDGDDGRSRYGPSCSADVRSDVHEDRHLHDVVV